MMFCAACFAAAIVIADEPTDSARIAWYTFAAGQGNVLQDESGHGHHGQIIGAQWQQVGEHWALHFDGRGDYVDFPACPDLKMQSDFTMLAWVTLDAPAYPDGLTNWTLFDCEAYPAAGTILRIDGAATKLMYRASRAGETPYQFGQARLANHGTYLLGVVRQGDRARLIVDGVADAEFTLGAPLYDATSFKISGPSQSFAGLFHEVQLFRRALTVHELAACYWQSAARMNKDCRAQGQLTVRGSAYVDDPLVVAEIELLGILPMTPDESVSVALLSPRGERVLAQSLPIIPDSCRAELRFDMSGQPPGKYELVATVTSTNDTERASARQTLAYPPSTMAPLPTAAEYQVPPLPVAPSRQQPTAAWLPGGGLEVRWNADLSTAPRSVRIDSNLSVPRGKPLLLSAAADPADEVRIEGPRATLETDYYRLERRMEVPSTGGRVVIHDTFRNPTAQPVGIRFAHRLALQPGQAKATWLAGQAITTAQTRPLKTNPTAFADLGGTGIGLVALDDVLIVQSQGTRDEQGLSLGSSEFALAAHAEYTVEWAVYATSSGDYYDLINLIRADEDRNRTTVTGTWTSPSRLMSKRTLEYVPPQTYFDVRRPGYFCIPCLSWSTDDPTVSLEGIEFIEYPRERAAVRQVLDAVRTVCPQLKTMFHIAPNLYATNRPDQLWPDSRILGADGRQTVYAYNYESCTYFTKERLADNWRWWSYYPAVDNAYGQALLDSVPVMMDEMGASGVFVDGALWDYGGGYSYDRFDGHTADIDPETGEIVRLKTAIPLLQQQAIVKWGQAIQERGGVLIANNAIPTRTISSQPFIFDREISEGPEVHLLPTPCTLGNPGAIQSEADVHQDVLAKLACGNLYFYYGEPLELAHELAPARMYPITVTEVRAQCVTGRERIVTARDGIYGWPADQRLHLVYHYDRRGRRVGHDFVTTVDAAGARTSVRLSQEELAILVKLPVTVECVEPVNARITRCGSEAVEVQLMGRGSVLLTGPNATEQRIQLDGEQVLSIPCRLEEMN
jgi:hypothetical protein